MNQATFSIPGSEFNEEIFERIKNLLGIDRSEFDVFIRVKRKETPAQMKKRIEESIQNIEKRENLITFTGQEYEQLVQKLSNQ